MRGPAWHNRPDHYAALSVELVHAVATGISVSQKAITLANGWTLTYDRLLIATGASPIRPDVPGLDHPRVQHCWTLEDARKIAELAHAEADVVLMGAGFIGSIVLEALVKKGVRLTVVEREAQMMPRILDTTAAGLLKRWCEERGVSVRTGCQVTEVSEGDGESLQVHLDTGETLPAALLVVAAGVRPNVDFLAGTGIAVGDGICVDAYLRSSQPDIYAAGDVAEGHDLLTGQHTNLYIQPIAVEHGRIAALNMAGQETPYPGGLAMNVLDTLGLVSGTFGASLGVPDGERAVALDERNFRYLRLEFSGDRLVGAQSLGLTDHVGALRGLIQSAIPLGAWKDRLMAAPEQVTAAYVALTR